MAHQNKTLALMNLNIHLRNSFLFKKYLPINTITTQTQYFGNLKTILKDVFTVSNHY